MTNDTQDHEHLYRSLRFRPSGFKSWMKATGDHIKHLVLQSNNSTSSSTTLADSMANSDEQRGQTSSAESSGSKLHKQDTNGGLNSGGDSKIQNAPQPQPGASIPIPSVEMYVLFGVKGSRRTLELAQIDAIKHSKDSNFFSNLLSIYKIFRGFWRYWFSVFRLNHCDFVEV